MKEFLEELIKNLVNNEQNIEITETKEDDAFVYNIKVDPEDMGRVIGKQGRTANAIRTVAKAKASKENQKVFIHIVEE